MSGGRHPRVYIVGAGFAGMSIAMELHRKRVLGEVTAFLDDDPAKIGTRIEGIPVLGPIADVVTLLNKRPADEALIAIPGASQERIRSVYRLLEQADFARIRILPSISQVLQGEAHLIQARDVDPQDLLGRTPVHIDLKQSLKYLRGKRVVVTGAGGTIGSELCRQLLSGGAERLYLFGHGENSIYDIERELRLLQEEGVGERATIVPVIGELQDSEFMRFILRRLQADVIFHAAAHKHVPLSETNPVGTIANNVFGTQNLVQAAREAGTTRLVFVSTDKVVEPRSVYGVSKRIAEEIVLQASDGEHDYMVVRFGNVLGARGSIIPLFQKQIRKGGPVTITHPDATRYFMTIPEAASLVLKVGGVGDSGGLYLLDMGSPISIHELAEQLVRFYGFEPHREISFAYTGLRPGEKLHEELTDSHEKPEETEYEKILHVRRTGWERTHTDAILRSLRPVCTKHPDDPGQYRNRRRLREILAEHFPSLPTREDEPEY